VSSIFVFKAYIFNLLLQHKNIFATNNNGGECCDIFNHTRVICRKFELIKCLCYSGKKFLLYFYYCKFDDGISLLTVWGLRSSIFKRQAVLGPLDLWTWDRWAIPTAWHLLKGPISCPETSVNTKQRCVTFQKSETLIYTGAEAWNHAHTNIWKEFLFYLWRP